MAIDSKLRGCDLVRMKVVDVMASSQITERASNGSFRPMLLKNSAPRKSPRKLGKPFSSMAKL